MCIVPSDAFRNPGGLCLALRASNSLVIFWIQKCLFTKWWRVGRSTLLLRNFRRCLHGLTGEWEETVSWQGQEEGPYSCIGVEKRGQESLCRQWWLEARQVIWSCCLRKLSATPWIMGAAVPFTPCHVLATTKRKLLLLKCEASMRIKKGRCGKNWNLWSVSHHTFCRNPFLRANPCLLVSQVRWKVGGTVEGGNAAGSLIAS